MSSILGGEYWHSCWSIAKPSIAKPTAMILVDLENVGTRALQNSIDVLHSLCTRASVKLRTYTAKRNNLASLATDTVASTAKNAVDVRIAFDIGRTSLKAGPGSRFLVVTKDHFGKALAEVPSASTDHVTLDSKLPRHWRNLLGVPSLGAVVNEAMRTKAAKPPVPVTINHNTGGAIKSRPAQPPWWTHEPGVSRCGKQCLVCGVSVRDGRELHDHLQGKKHQRSLARMHARMVAVPSRRAQANRLQ